MIPEILQEFVDRINLKLRYHHPNNTKTYRLIQCIDNTPNYILQSYEDIFWATGDNEDGWYPWGTVLDLDTLVNLTDYRSEHDMELFLKGMLNGIQLMILT